MPPSLVNEPNQRQLPHRKAAYVPNDVNLYIIDLYGLIGNPYLLLSRY
jgi:hypothetical protein